jgi:hypothetical protein
MFCYKLRAQQQVTVFQHTLVLTKIGEKKPKYCGSTSVGDIRLLPVGEVGDKHKRKFEVPQSWCFTPVTCSPPAKKRRKNIIR